VGRAGRETCDVTHVSDACARLGVVYGCRSGNVKKKRFNDNTSARSQTRCDSQIPGNATKHESRKKVLCGAPRPRITVMRCGAPRPRITVMRCGAPRPRITVMRCGAPRPLRPTVNPTHLVEDAMAKEIPRHRVPPSLDMSMGVARLVR
jgi:hypothetical protein